MMRFKDILIALLTVTIWGVNFSVIKFGLSELPPLLFSALRFLIVAVPAVLFIPWPKTTFWRVFATGLFLGVIKFSLLFIALRNDISPGIAALVLQVQVFFTVGLSLIFYNESILRRQMLGMAIALIGFSLLFLAPGGNFTDLGLGLVIGAGLSWAIANLFMKGIPEVNRAHFIAWVCLIPPLPLLLLSYQFETTQPIDLILAASFTTWLSLAFVGFVSTLLAFSLWAGLLGRYSAATVSPFALLVPIVGLVSAGLFFGETLTPMEIAAAIGIMVGLAICQFDISKWRWWPAAKTKPKGRRYVTKPPRTHKHQGYI